MKPLIILFTIPPAMAVVMPLAFAGEGYHIVSYSVDGGGGREARERRGFQGAS